MTHRKILIVGDSPHNATGLDKHLQSLDCEVTVANTLSEAKQSLRERRFDVLLATLILPDGNADGLLRHFHSEDGHALFTSDFDDSSWWVHVVDGGENRWWQPEVVAPEDFLSLLTRCTAANVQTDAHTSDANP